ncbi:hypothetical protein AX774_g4670 [Zancudomyces culisetae]|uniref:Septicolysin n=1 Tax=Zancudomyces culisetae TaxID=1213189 RepID=A0A1R1PLX2_ZANCU|nr:hypothetical protein AX774_g4670 [Zancudomyces culisetae]|eukprot:OMH81872.1 hypothetical protein AX774_g4670 [Zancudomyces culisetae]
MRLAEALILRADLDKSITDLKNRIVNNSLVQDGTKPAEDPERLFTELYAKIQELEDLIVRINSTNLAVKTDSGLSITSAIAKRDSLEKLHRILDAVSSHANTTVNRYSKTEILNVATVDIVALRKKIDKLAKERREIDVQIQAANWTNELV